MASETCGLDTRGRSGRARRLAKGVREAARIEQGRVDVACECPDAGERVPGVALQLVEQLERRGEIACDELAEELETDGDRDQVLLDSVVEGTLDPTPVGAGGGGKARS